MSSFFRNRRGRVFAALIGAMVILFLLWLFASDAIRWRSGPLTRIYDFGEGYQMVSMDVYSRRDGEIFFSADERELDKLRETFLDLDWRPADSSVSIGADSALLDKVRICVFYQNEAGNQKALEIYCTGDDTINVRAFGMPAYRKNFLDYQAAGGYDLGWMLNGKR